MKNKTAGVYLIMNTTNGMFYIGSSSDLDRRKKQHFDMLKYGKHPNRGLQEDYDAGDNFTFIVVKKLPVGRREVLLEEESSVIELYKSTGIKLYNVAEMRTGSRFISPEGLRNMMADQYCIQRFGTSVNNLLASRRPAELEMYKELVMSPVEDEDRIRAEYAPIIKYQNEEHYKEFKRFL